MWHEPAPRAALLELIQTGKLRKRRAQAEAWQELLEIGWARRTGRQDELVLADSCREDVLETLSRCWPDWRTTVTELASHSLPVTESGLRQLHLIRRSVRTKDLPVRLNQRTAASALAAHSKSRIRFVEPLRHAASEITTDYLIRLRGCQDMSLVRESIVYDAATQERVHGELILSERALLDGTELFGNPDALLLVENLGAFVDMTPSPGWLLVHVPGWNTQGARRLFSMFPQTVTIHFGDLDPKGFAILQHLREHRPSLMWVVPDWAAEYLPTHGLPTTWPTDNALSETPHLIQRLVQEGLWLEQESLVLDNRLWPSLCTLAGLSETLRCSDEATVASERPDTGELRRNSELSAKCL